MPTETQSPQHLAEKPGKKRRIGRILLPLALLAVLALAGGVLWCSYAGYLELPAGIQTRIDLLPEVNAQEGTPNADLSGAASGPEEFQVVLNQFPTIRPGGRTCNIELENAASNAYDVRLVLTLAETGEELAATHRVGRGRRVDELQLDRAFSEGEYHLVATMELYDGGQKLASSVSVPVDLRVVEEVSE